MHLRRNGVSPGKCGRWNSHVNSWTPPASAIDKSREPRRGRSVLHVSRLMVLMAVLALVAASVIFSLLSLSRTGNTPLASGIQATYDNDVSVDSINSPTGTIFPGNVTVNATVSNVGNLSTGSFQVNLTVVQTGLPDLVFNDSFETGSVPPPGWGDYSKARRLCHP
jgi:hypothetical protein